MDFRTATSRLKGCVTLGDIAEATGRSYATIKQARMTEGHPSYRAPPDKWPTVLAQLARDRAAQLQEIAAELETEGAE